MRITRSRCALLVIASLVGAGCTTVTTGAFTQVLRIEPELRRGVATKADVERILGTPKGRGGTLLPGMTSVREVWSYEEVQATGLRLAGQTAEGTRVFEGDLQHQLLLVIFDGGVLDGYVWYTSGSAGVESGRR